MNISPLHWHSFGEPQKISVQNWFWLMLPLFIHTSYTNDFPFVVVLIGCQDPKTPNHCCRATKRVGSSRFWKIKDAHATFKVKIRPSFRTQLYKAVAHWQHIKGISIEKNLVTEVRSNEVVQAGKIRNHFTITFKILQIKTFINGMKGSWCLRSNAVMNRPRCSGILWHRSGGIDLPIFGLAYVAT